MSELVIPERWQSEIDQDGDTLLRECCQELGASEAKVSELETKFAEAERLRLYSLDQVTDLLKQNALWQADNRGKAATIERLAQYVVHEDQCPYWSVDGVARDLCTCGLAALLSQQDPEL